MPWSSHKASLAFIIIYLVIFLLPAVLIALPTPSWFDFSIGVFLGFTSFYHIPATLVLVTTQFLPQIALAWRLRHSLKSTSISVWTLGLQMILFALLGISWRLRLGTIRVGWGGLQSGLSKVRLTGMSWLVGDALNIRYLLSARRDCPSYMSLLARRTFSMQGIVLIASKLTRQAETS